MVDLSHNSDATIIAVKITIRQTYKPLYSLDNDNLDYFMTNKGK